MGDIKAVDNPPIRGLKTADIILSKAKSADIRVPSDPLGALHYSQGKGATGARVYVYGAEMEGLAQGSEFLVSWLENNVPKAGRLLRRGWHQVDILREDDNESPSLGAVGHVTKKAAGLVGNLDPEELGEAQKGVTIPLIKGGDQPPMLE
ncbi:uncharacterized protein EI90DRAFT_3130468 [Cantharellus anzutake]|uniref:uncharacterized protein n=1 Tax=Cantharellus anzutake TaxID=1750568 RepID=UPI0019059A3D|nr:uncharacterized protein EI90DRAFT_3130468 [Cantharellus anzutake]KAF8322977.1 hypothetical protein EI90DRAFT_3130468 [Cantharellus anzutake]